MFVKQIKNDFLLREIIFRIRDIRQNKGITQEVFYNDTNIHIGRIESEHQNITISTLHKICEYLETPLATLLRGL